ncbi:ABC transporter ATP-binding protein [Eisenibacter elegans]|uniref:ABC transporter ATP-binding protein n=1 Tax=Eisenibacter elegans TaxID=997 RepID=UPI0004180807|nr:ABC transporter ATP-binding protein [Eisenibacter elegans]
MTPNAILVLHHLCKRYAPQLPWAVNNVSMAVDTGELVAILGESGSGKTSLLRLVAGFEVADKGTIYLREACMADERRFVAPERRNIGMVFQDYALFPHLSVEDNICFGLRQWSREARKARLQEMVQLVELHENLRKYPHQLSGGQQQRVALARALAPKPDMLLLDEPFSNLDGILRTQIREDIRQIIKKTGITALFVTHDVQDALAIADRIAVMRQGQLLQFDTPQALYQSPQSVYVARFFGQANCLRVVVENGSVYSPWGTIPHHHQEMASLEAWLVLRPEHLYINTQASPQVVASQVLRCLFAGTHYELYVQLEQALLKVQSSHPIAEGSTVYLGLKEAKAPHCIPIDVQEAESRI